MFLNCGLLQFAQTLSMPSRFAGTKHAPNPDSVHFLEAAPHRGSNHRANHGSRRQTPCYQTVCTLHCCCNCSPFSKFGWGVEIAWNTANRYSTAFIVCVYSRMGGHTLSSQQEKGTVQTEDGRHVRQELEQSLDLCQCCRERF